MSIAPALLNQISTADDARVLRALEAIQSGTMRVEIRYNAGVLTAEVTSTTALGKKKPVEKTETYSTILTPTRGECTCKDFQYRGTICKHILASALVGEDEQRYAA